MGPLPACWSAITQRKTTGPKPYQLLRLPYQLLLRLPYQLLLRLP